LVLLDDLSHRPTSQLSVMDEPEYVHDPVLRNPKHQRMTGFLNPFGSILNVVPAKLNVVNADALTETTYPFDTLSLRNFRNVDHSRG